MQKYACKSQVFIGGVSVNDLYWVLIIETNITFVAISTSSLAKKLNELLPLILVTSGGNATLNQSQ